MKLADFIKYGPTEQLRPTSSYGTLLAERAVGYNTIYLYALGPFFVELFYEIDNVNNSHLRIYRVSEDKTVLDDYMKDPEITRLSLQVTP